MKDYEIVVGLEVHAELNTKSKIYCNCRNAFGLEVNTQVCPVCMGMPGTLPTLNEKVVEYQLLYTDETSSEFREVALKTYVQGIENSKYIDTYLSGKSNKIAIRIFAPNINVEEICINDKIPFNFSLVRFICVYLFLVFLCVVREYDIFKSTIANFNYKHECILLVVLAIFCMLIFY